MEKKSSLSSPPFKFDPYFDPYFSYILMADVPQKRDVCFFLFVQKAINKKFTSDNLFDKQKLLVYNMDIVIFDFASYIE